MGDAYDKGMQADIFVRGLDGQPYLGQVWPGPVYFPDFTHPNAQAYWSEQVKNYHSMVPVDGIWIDMNEVSNFCNSDGTGQSCYNPGNCPDPQHPELQTQCCLQCKQIDAGNSLDFPPYHIGNQQMNGALGAKTMPPSAVFYNNVSNYDMHNLYGISEAKATQAALEATRGERAFSLTRSSFMGSGVYTAKWTGDNAATWQDLQSSIVSIMGFNLFGIPMIGADICGFIGATTEELCSRWIEVGAFYPFSRNHNSLGEPPQELYLWESVTEASKNALGMRYQLLPYFYTGMYAAHAEGVTFAKSLFFNFPADNNAAVDEQFMLGDFIMVSPAVHEGQTSVSAYFPQAIWYDFGTGAQTLDASKGGQTLSLDTPLTKTNVHVRGGAVLPLQAAALTTVAGRQTPFRLVVAPDATGQAAGSLFWDDGKQISLNDKITVQYKAKTSASKGSLEGLVTAATYQTDLNVQMIEVWGYSSATAPTTFQLNGKKTNADASVQDGKLTISVSLPLGKSFYLSWSA